MAAVAVGFLFASSATAGVIVAMGDTEGGGHGQIAIEGGSDDVTLVAGQPQPTWDFAEDGNSKGLDVNLDSPTLDSLNNSDFTVATWVLLDYGHNHPDQDDADIWGFEGGDDGDFPRFQLESRGGGYRPSLRDSDNNHEMRWDTQDDDEAIPIGVPVHYLLSYSSLDGNANLWINGVLQEVDRGGGDLIFDDMESGSELEVGGKIGDSNWFVGQIGGLAVYDQQVNGEDYFNGTGQWAGEGTLAANDFRANVGVIPEPAEVPFQITEVTYTPDPAMPTVEISWASLPGESFILERTPAGIPSWEEIDDSYPAADAPATVTTFQDGDPSLGGTSLLGVPRMLYRVTRKSKGEEVDARKEAQK